MEAPKRSVSRGLSYSGVHSTTMTACVPLVLVNQSYCSSKYPPHLVLDMPALSPTMKSGNFVKWLKNVGDPVYSGDVLADIETDKATMKWDSADEGFLAKKFVEDGSEDVPVNTPVAILVEEKADVAAFADYQVDSAPKSQPAAEEAPSVPEPKSAPEPQAPKQQEAKPASSTPKSAPSGGRVFASPAAKALAKEKGFDINQIRGSGPNQRVTLADVKGFTGASVSAPRAAPVSVSSIDVEESEYVDIPNNKIRKVVASRLTESKQQIPHYYLSVEFCVDELMKVRATLNGQSNGEYKISLNDFVIKASAMALRKVPEVNSAWMGTFIRRYNNVHINVAVNTDEGLFTPIVLNTDNKGLVDISNNVRELAAKAHDSKLNMDDLASGTFTISNLGMFGIKNFSAVINPPQACILAVGGIEKRVVAVENPETGETSYKNSNFMSCTLSCDHRVVDGAVGAIWLKEFKTRMEQPLTLLL